MKIYSINGFNQKVFSKVRGGLSRYHPLILLSHFIG